MSVTCTVCGGSAARGGFLKLTRRVHGWFITASRLGEPGCEGCLEWMQSLRYPRSLAGLFMKAFGVDMAQWKDNPLAPFVKGELLAQ